MRENKGTRIAAHIILGLLAAGAIAIIVILGIWLHNGLLWAKGIIEALI